MLKCKVHWTTHKGGAQGQRNYRGRCCHLLAKDPDNVVRQGDAKGEEEDEASDKAPRELRRLHGPCLPVPVASQVPTHCPTQCTCDERLSCRSDFLMDRLFN